MKQALEEGTAALDTATRPNDGGSENCDEVRGWEWREPSWTQRHARTTAEVRTAMKQELRVRRAALDTTTRRNDGGSENYNVEVADRSIFDLLDTNLDRERLNILRLSWM
jgi:hypothetical protein